MIKRFKVIPFPTKDNTGIVLITQGVCSGSLVKKEYYGMLQEDMGDTYVHLIGIGEETIEKGDTVFNLNTKEIYKCKEEYGVECEKVILFSTDSSLTYERKFEYKIPTIHRSTYTGLIQQHNHREGMWLDVLMEKPEAPGRTDDVHLDAVNFNHWLDIKDKWFIRTFNNIVVVKGEVSEITHPNNVATNYIQDSKIKGDDARMVSRAFKAGMDYVNTQLAPNVKNKSLEDIQSLAKSESNNDSKHAHVKLGYQDGIYYGFIEGYTKAQNDSEKKYTLEDMKKIFNHGYGDNDHLGFDHYINKI